MSGIVEDLLAESILDNKRACKANLECLFLAPVHARAKLRRPRQIWVQMQEDR